MSNLYQVVEENTVTGELRVLGEPMEKGRAVTFRSRCVVAHRIGQQIIARNGAVAPLELRFMVEPYEGTDNE